MGGRIIYALVVAFLAFDGITKAMKLEFIGQATTQFGYPEGAVFGIGLTLLVCTVIHRSAHGFSRYDLAAWIPRCAVAAQVRAEDPWFVFQPYRVVGVGRLFLRDGRIRVLVSK